MNVCAKVHGRPRALESKNVHLIVAEETKAADYRRIIWEP